VPENGPNNFIPTITTNNTTTAPARIGAKRGIEKNLALDRAGWDSFARIFCHTCWERLAAKSVPGFGADSLPSDEGFELTQLLPGRLNIGHVFFRFLTFGSFSFVINERT